MNVSFPIVMPVELPQDAGYVILSALAKRFPALHDRTGLQIGPVCGTLLPNKNIRTNEKSVIHMRGLDPAEVQEIGKSWISVPSGILLLGDPRPVRLHPMPNLGSRLVVYEGCTQPDDLKRRIEQEVGPGVHVEVKRFHSFAMKNMTFIGHAVHLYGLSPEKSLWVQNTGLGRFTSMGCGVFGPVRASGSAPS